jgi:hypothetical protein
LAEVQLTWLVRFSVVPSLKSPVQEDWSVNLRTESIGLWSDGDKCRTLHNFEFRRTVVAPGSLAISRPSVLGDELLMMCATFSLEEVQSTSDVTFSMVPSEKMAAAIICSVSPPGRVGLEGVTISEVRAGDVTVRFVEPGTPWKVAMIEVLPTWVP